MIDFFLERLMQLCGDLRALGRARLGAYGPSTGEKLREWHLRPAAVAADHKTGLILEAIQRCGDVRGQKFLVLRGEKAAEQVPEALERLGAAAVEVVPCFVVEPEDEAPFDGSANLLEKGADWLTFASALAIEHFHARFDLPKLMARFPQMRLAIASPTIAWALEELGLRAAVIAQPNNVGSLVGGIVQATSAGGGPDRNSQQKKFEVNAPFERIIRELQEQSQ